jgi:hypothetical protein
MPSQGTVLRRKEISADQALASSHTVPRRKNRGENTLTLETLEWGCGKEEGKGWKQGNKGRRTKKKLREIQRE